MKLFYLCFLCNVIFLRTVPAWGDSSFFVLWIAIASGCQSHLAQRVEFHVKLWFMGHCINIQIAYFLAQPYPRDVKFTERSASLSWTICSLLRSQLSHLCFSFFLPILVPWERHCFLKTSSATEKCSGIRLWAVWVAKRLGCISPISYVESCLENFLYNQEFLKMEAGFYILFPWIRQGIQAMFSSQSVWTETNLMLSVAECFSSSSATSVWTKCGFITEK